MTIVIICQILTETKLIRNQHYRAATAPVNHAGKLIKGENDEGSQFGCIDVDAGPGGCQQLGSKRDNYTQSIVAFSDHRRVRRILNFRVPFIHGKRSGRVDIAILFSQRLLSVQG